MVLLGSFSFFGDDDDRDANDDGRFVVTVRPDMGRAFVPVASVADSSDGNGDGARDEIDGVNKPRRWTGACFFDETRSDARSAVCSSPKAGFNMSRLTVAVDTLDRL